MTLPPDLERALGNERPAEWPNGTGCLRGNGRLIVNKLPDDVMTICHRGHVLKLHIMEYEAQQDPLFTAYDSDPFKTLMTPSLVTIKIRGMKV